MQAAQSGGMEKESHGTQPVGLENATQLGGAEEETRRTATPSDKWRAHLATAIKQLDSEAAKTAQTAEGMSEHANLRMLQLIAGRRKDALQPIPSVPPSVQKFWTSQLYGLSVWLDAEKSPDWSHRAAEAQEHFTEALTALGESAPLRIRNLAFCTRIQAYGTIDEFPENVFVPAQEVVLYAEVENFASEQTPKGHHTVLQSNCQIFDGSGRRVADVGTTTTEEHCRRCRRDFFIGYNLCLPKQIYPGKHTLKLTIEDLKSHKVAESSIDFTVRTAKD